MKNINSVADIDTSTAEGLYLLKALIIAASLNNYYSKEQISVDNVITEITRSKYVNTQCFLPCTNKCSNAHQIPDFSNAAQL